MKNYFKKYMESYATYLFLVLKSCVVFMPSAWKNFFLQEAQLFRIIMPGEEELGSTQPQTMCFITRFSHSDFISSDAMSKLRQVCICFSSPTPTPAPTLSAFLHFISKHRAFYICF